MDNNCYLNSFQSYVSEDGYIFKEISIAMWFLSFHHILNVGQIKYFNSNSKLIKNRIF